MIVFTGHPVGKAKSSVWFVNGDGSGLVEMTPNDKRNDFDAPFSPEGGPHVVYVGKPMGGGDGDLYVIDRSPPAAVCRSPSTSPTTSTATPGTPRSRRPAARSRST